MFLLAPLQERNVLYRASLQGFGGNFPLFVRIFFLAFHSSYTSYTKNNIWVFIVFID